MGNKYSKELMNKLYQEVAENITSAGDNYDASFREDYVGRGMRDGGGVPAIVTNAPAVLVGIYFAFAFEDLSEFEADDALLFCPLAWDELGRDKLIFYDNQARYDND